MNEFEKFNPNSQITTSKPKNESQPSQLGSQDIIEEEPPAREPFEIKHGEIEEIEKIRDQLRTEIETIKGQQYTVQYVSKEEIYPAYGYGGGNSAVVRQDLPPRVKKFVKAHELYHCQDKSNFGGWLGREIRANVIPGLKDPIGLMATVWKTITDIDRIKFYLKRIKEGH